jgi:hypothetical protein
MAFNGFELDSGCIGGGGDGAGVDVGLEGTSEGVATEYAALLREDFLCTSKGC